MHKGYELVGGQDPFLGAVPAFFADVGQGVAAEAVAAFARYTPI
ncbi:MAG TPA: hypothetical protein P5175_08635 [Anaerohalosphaeraceae bacterium]|nr:hypothetical protein [Anaerohalosphaeraceae bacterium]